MKTPEAGATGRPVPGDAELRERIERYGALDLASQPVWIFDIDQSRVHWANRAALGVWRATGLEELCARDMALDMSESVAQRLRQHQIDFVENDAVFNEQWTIYPHGAPVSLFVTFSGHAIDGGRMAMLCQAKSVVEETPESLRSVEALLHTAVMISLYGRDGAPLYRNPAARASVRRLDEPLAVRIALPADHARLMASLSQARTATLTLPVHTSAGQRWHELSARNCHDAVTGLDALLVSEVDVTALKRTEAKANFLALHDSLTGLPNRAHVMQGFSEAFALLAQSGAQAALIFLDLDHFKNVNDALGHAAGDALLKEIARRLRESMRGTDLVARLGGDEFLILVTSGDIEADVGRVRERIVRAVSQPVALTSTEVVVTTSMGVSLFPRDGTDIETLLRKADLAMYSAKERGRDELAYFEESMGVALRTRAALETDLRRALERDEFEVHYQPRVAVDSHRIVGVEALVRWRHPERGLVMPDVFIPVCESTGLIRQIGMRVFEQTVRQQVEWARRGRPLKVSVNLSGRQFSDPKLLQDLQRVLEQEGCDPGQVELEVTESMLLGSDERPAQVLAAIKALGMSIALDDFGTGYSNLAYLQRYPIQTLKIDKTFIQGIEADRPLAELIVAMCQLMRLGVVAEGVETQEQLDWVASRGIGQYQGYFFSRPRPAGELEALLGLAGTP
jgi:diguanylate cyclase (GGDEF)-like protein